MYKLTDCIYIHRNHLIIKDEQGICVENHLEIFKSLIDAKEFINKFLDGSNKKEPVIVGMWCTEPEKDFRRKE